MKTFVNYSMGVCSTYIAARLKDEGHDPICVFSDTKREDIDTYRFGCEIVEKWELKLVDASDGRDLFDFFEQQKMIPARQYAACSIALKILPSQMFYEKQEPGTIAYGYDLDEEDRAERTRAKWSLTNHTPVFPMLEWQVSKSEAMGYFVKHGIKLPRTYQHFSHANCMPCKNWRKNDWVACLHFYPSVFIGAMEFEDRTGLRWMQDGPTLREIYKSHTPYTRKRRKKLPVPSFSFDIGCDRCAS